MHLDRSRLAPPSANRSLVQASIQLYMFLLLISCLLQKKGVSTSSRIRTQHGNSDHSNYRYVQPVNYHRNFKGFLGGPLALQESIGRLSVRSQWRYDGSCHMTKHTVPRVQDSRASAGSASSRRLSRGKVVETIATAQ